VARLKLSTETKSMELKSIVETTSAGHVGSGVLLGVMVLALLLFVLGLRAQNWSFEAQMRLELSIMLLTLLVMAVVIVLIVLGWPQQVKLPTLTAPNQQSYESTNHAVSTRLTAPEHESLASKPHPSESEIGYLLSQSSAPHVFEALPTKPLTHFGGCSLFGMHPLAPSYLCASESHSWLNLLSGDPNYRKVESICRPAHSALIEGLAYSKYVAMTPNEKS
jgi:hypothetical protein